MVKEKFVNAQLVDRLKNRLDKLWEKAFRNSSFLNYVLNEEVPKKLYVLYLIETFHYTKHNALNQALVGARRDLNDFSYQRFCFHHAEEEVGHQMMALKDINNLGYKLQENDLPKPLPETTILISYLYWVSKTGNPVQRLGYSFWAESCYSYINHVLKKVKDDLALSDKQMTFFIAHSEIDAGHAQEVERILVKTCKSEDDFKDVSEVMEVSLRLTINMMDAVYREYDLQLVNGASRSNFQEI